MFDVGDLTVLTFGNCVLKTGATKWPLKLYVLFYVFDVFSKTKNTTFLRLLSCRTRFSRQGLHPVLCQLQHFSLVASCQPSDVIDVHVVGAMSPLSGVAM